jgi:hypothetical protein
LWKTKKIGLTIASSEQEAASTLVLIVETASRCLLSLTQALGHTSRHDPTTRHPGFRDTDSARTLPAHDVAFRAVLARHGCRHWRVRTGIALALCCWAGHRRRSSFRRIPLDVRHHWSRTVGAVSDLFSDDVAGVGRASPEVGRCVCLSAVPEALAHARCLGVGVSSTVWPNHCVERTGGSLHARINS